MSVSFRRGCGALQQLALRCPSLRSVDATFCGSLTDYALVAAVRGLPSLQTLLLAVRPSLCPCCVVVGGCRRRGQHLLCALSAVFCMSACIKCCRHRNHSPQRTSDDVNFRRRQGNIEM